MWRLYLATSQDVIKPNGCHIADEADDTYATVIKNQCNSKHAQDWKEFCKSSSRPKGANKHNNWQSNGGHCLMTYCCFVESNTSSHDSYCSHQDNNQHS
eukprot:15335397-Ditylum_brightwellii.AAC.1